jgi:hypothetical protein
MGGSILISGNNIKPHPEARPLGRVSKDGKYIVPSWFETAQERRLIVRDAFVLTPIPV